MEETQARNHELEKKQRKFDSEMCGQQAETTQHKIDKDKSIREKENLQAQLMKMKADLDQKIEDLDFANNRIERLEYDIKDQIVRDDGKIIFDPLFDPFFDPLFDPFFDPLLCSTFFIIYSRRRQCIESAEAK